MIKKYYAVKNSNNDERIISSSGGVFLALAKKVLADSGVVYGAIYNDNFEVIHSRADNESDLLKMTGSKYSESDFSKILKDVQKDLSNGKKVLVSGTPCQIKIINQLSKINNTNLITIDIVCHGTPKKKYLKSYLSYMEKKYKSTISNINMRYKNELQFNKNLNKRYHIISTIVPHYMKIDFSNGKRYIERSDFDSYYLLFEYFINNGCFHCPFSNLNRVSDITIGDFHEVSSRLKEFNDGNGVSLVIINSEKGNIIFNKIKKELIVVEKNEKECLQPALIHPAEKIEKYDQFQNDFDKFGYEYVTKKYATNGIKYKIKWLLYKTKILDLILKIKNR